MNKKNFLLIALLIVSTAIFFISYNFYQKIFNPNVKQNSVLYIKTHSSIHELEKNLKPHLENVDDFIWTAQKKKFTRPKAGKYNLKKGMSSNDLINLLRSGRQTPVKVSFNNQDNLEKLAKRIAEQIEADSTSLIKAMKEPSFLKKNNFTEKSILGMFLPNSYEFYWNTSAENFRDKMLKEYHKFWNKSRTEKAKKLNLSIKEVTTLASIVQKETAKKSERPIVAGLYLNRLKSGWPLQADPTVIYAIKEQKGQDFIVKRVLSKDLNTKSAYNTYIHKGLPPALISMPDISAIDGVLNAKKHNYYYMCASTTKIGYHTFANSLSQHNRNATNYHRWLNKQGINR